MASPPILTLSEIALGYGQVRIFDGLSLTIQPSDRLCLVGRNGSGKSTLMKVMAGLVPPESGNRVLQPRMAVSYMEQDPDLNQYETLRDYATSALDDNEFYRAEIAAEGLKLSLDTPSATASGGEKRRAALAKIIAEDPDLMLLDEPTNHLDIHAIEWLEDHLAATQKAFVLISHDRSFLRRLTRGTLWVDRGIVRQQARGFDRFEEWRDKTFEEEDMAAHKLKRLIKVEARWAVEGISARRKRNQGRVRRLAELRSEQAAHIKRAGPADFAFEQGEKSGKLVIEAKNISKGFGDQSLFSDFSIKIMRSERIALIGPNGVGKTTLLKTLIGQIEPDEGHLRLGKNLSIAEFDQTRAALDPEQTLWDAMTNDTELGVSGKNDQIMVRGSPRHVVGYLKDFLFDESQIRGPISVLSGGERARLLLARLMARDSNLLILDEPTNDLDVETLDLLQEVLDGYAGTVLLVSHDRDFLDRVATRSVVMEGQSKAVIYSGGWSDYQAQRGEVAQGTPAKAKSEKPKPKRENRVEPKSGLSFTEQHRLSELPNEISRLEAEIAKLQEFLSQPDLFTTDRVKFDKATEGLVARQSALDAAETEWLELEARANP